jgi:hypothetical protein
MPRVPSSFNAAAVNPKKAHARNFTHIEPKDAYEAKESWWIQPTTADFMVRRDAELPRLLKQRSTYVTAESGNTARQTFVARRSHPVMAWVPDKRSEGSE